MNINALKRSEKAMGGLAVVAVIAIFMFAFMFSKPVVTGLVTGNDSFNISENISLENISMDNISIESDISEGLNVQESENISLNTSIIEENISVENESAYVVLTLHLKNISKNLTDVNLSIKIKSKVSQVTEHVVGRVRINSPVKFIKKIKLTGARKDLVVKLPQNASKIIVKKLVNGIGKDISDKVVVKDKERVRDLDEYNLITGGIVVEIDDNIFDRIVDWFTSFVGITGYVISEINETELVIEEEVEEVEIEYEIPGPIAVEEELSNWKKRIVISSEIHYEDILSYVFIKDSNAESVRLNQLDYIGSKIMAEKKLDMMVMILMMMI